MRLSNPVDSLASALHHAAEVALPELRYENRNFNSSDPMAKVLVTRRPEAQECVVRAMFSQTWGSTALGFGGIGGAAVTPAYTTVIEGPHRDLAVYWNGSFGYLVRASNQAGLQALEQDLVRQRTLSRRDAAQQYGAELPHERHYHVTQGPLEPLAGALFAATLRDLPAIPTKCRDFSSPDRNAMTIGQRRPTSAECEVLTSFLQKWATSALGFEDRQGFDLGGQPIPTTAIKGPGGDVAVYWNNELAYLVAGDNAQGLAALRQDLCACTSASQTAAALRYGVKAGPANPHA